MNKLDCTLPELVNILVTTEEILKSSRDSVLAVEQEHSSKRKSSWKKRNKPAKKQKKEKKLKKDTPKKATDKEKYFNYNADSH